MKSINKIELSCIEYKSRFYSFWKPLCFIIEKDEKLINSDKKYWICKNMDIQLICYTENFSDILKEICETFDYLYREIVMKDDSELDTKAKIIKKRILNLIA